MTMPAGAEALAGIVMSQDVARYEVQRWLCIVLVKLKDLTPHWSRSAEGSNACDTWA